MAPKVTMQIAEEDFAFAAMMAERNGFCGPEDFLADVLHHAILQERTPPTFDLVFSSEPGECPLCSGDRRAVDDYDDGIPF